MTHSTKAQKAKKPTKKQWREMLFAQARHYPLVLITTTEGNESWRILTNVSFTSAMQLIGAAIETLARKELLPDTYPAAWTTRKSKEANT